MMEALGKQSRESSQTEPNRASPLASQTRSSSTPCGSYKCYFPYPEPGESTRLNRRPLLGIHLDSALAAKSCALQRRGSRPLGSRGGARSQSLHLQNAGTLRSGPGGCPHLHPTPRRPYAPLCSSLILENICFTLAI